MKLYWIFMRDGAWQVCVGEPEHVIAQSHDKDALLKAAREVAARRAGELYVCDESGNLDVIYAYSEGAESVRFPAPALVRTPSPRRRASTGVGRQRKMGQAPRASK